MKIARATLFIITASVMGAMLLTSCLAAAPYGGGTYGGCEYNSGCEEEQISEQYDEQATKEQENQPPGETSGITIEITDDSLSAPQGDPVFLRINISEGSAPFDVTIDWGDGTTERFETNNASLEIEHTYQNFGSVAGSILVVGQSNTDWGDFRVNITQPSLLSRLIPDTIEQTLRPMEEAITRRIETTPPEVAYSFPYALFALLLTLMLLVLYQAKREVRHARHIMQFVEKEKALAEEKDNFIMLSSHYLRTPTTILKGGVELLKDQQAASQTTVLKQLESALSSLGDKIEALLSDVQNNKALAGIRAPKEFSERVRAYASPYFLLPFIIIGALFIISTYLFSVVGVVQLSAVDLIIQILVFATVSFLFYSSIRTYHTEKRQRYDAQQLLRQQEILDKARNEFINKSMANLREDIDRISDGLSDIPASASGVDKASAGLKRLESIIAKFELLATLRSGRAESAKRMFDLHHVIGEVVEKYRSQFSEKRIELSIDAKTKNILQNPNLIDRVLDSLLDNALKFTPENGSVTIFQTEDDQGVRIDISNTGEGIPEDKLERIFKPFSRPGSALQFEHEGAGLSLFIDKIIMAYLGGDITAESVSDQKTTFSLHLSNKK